jgi:TonB family protein
MLAALVALPVTADFSEGLEAYESGDFETAYEHFSYAAELGHGEAQFNLGAMYVNGEFVEQDVARAWGWLTLASERGIERADPVLEQLTQYLDEAQREAAVLQLRPYTLESLQVLLLPDPPAPPPPPSEERGPTNSDPMNRGVSAISRVPPRFPREAAMRGWQGDVLMEFTITSSGYATEIEVLNAPHRGVFNRDAIRAVRQWRFEPRIEDGIAVPTRAQTTIQFRLQGMGDGRLRIPEDYWDVAERGDAMEMARRGDSDAQYLVAYFMDATPQYSSRRSEILDLYLRSAQGGNADAQHHLADMLRRGDACEIDRAKADRWMSLAIEGGSSDAMLDAAILQLRTDDPDLVEVESQLRSAIEAGNKRANLYLARLLVTAYPTEARAEEALDLLGGETRTAHEDDPSFHQLRAYARAVAGDWRRAISLQRDAIDLAEDLLWETAEMEVHLAAYREREIPDPGFIN